MMDWKIKEIGNALSSIATSNAIMQSFGAAFLAAGQPIDMGVFVHDDPPSDKVTVYFSPSAENLALIFDATPCSKPEQDGHLRLLVGSTPSFDIHFPSRQSQQIKPPSLRDTD